MRKSLKMVCAGVCLTLALTSCGTASQNSGTNNQAAGQFSGETVPVLTTEQPTTVTTTELTTESTTEEETETETETTTETSSETDSTTESETTTEASTEAAIEATEAPAAPESGDYGSIDNTKYSWWFVRNDTHTTPGCQNDFDISQYHAYYVNPSPADNTIYLTIDCGYENGYMPQILDTLRDKDVKAIFFVTQHYIETQPDLVKRMKEEGHLVGNHTKNHPSLPTLSIDEQRAELESCANCMKEMTGYDMDPYIRPPMGEYSQRTLQLMEDMGYCTVFWSIAFLDYDVNNQPTVDYVIDHFNQYVHPGAVPLLHCVSSADTEALPRLIDTMREQGYRFARLDEFCHF